MGRLTRLAPALALAASAVGCGSWAPELAGAGFGAAADRFLPPPGPAADTGTFLLVEEQDTFATERFRRGHDRLETDLVVHNQVRVRTTTSLRDDDSVRRIEIRLFPPEGDDPEPFQSSAADFAGDTLRLEEPIGARVAAGHYPHLVVPEIDLSAAYLEQLLRHARALERDAPDTGTRRATGASRTTVPVPIWRPGTGNAIDTALVAFDDDRATILLRETGIRAHTDAAGRLLAAVIPDLALLIHRR